MSQKNKAPQLRDRPVDPQKALPLRRLTESVKTEVLIEAFFVPF